MPKFQDVSAKWLAIKDEQSSANEEWQETSNHTLCRQKFEWKINVYKFYK